MASTAPTAGSRPDSGNRQLRASRQLPKLTPLWVAIGSIVVAGVLSLLLVQSLNVAIIAILAGIVNAIALYAISRSVEGARKATDRLATTIVTSTFAVACIPLLSLLLLTIVNGAPHLTLEFLGRTSQGLTGTHDQAWIAGDGPLLGGILHAIWGTVLITLTAAIISVPVGILTSIYLVEYGGKKPLARAITFFVDVMTGIPSIVAGLFAFALFSIVLELFGLPLTAVRTGFTAAVALSVLMIPIVVRNTEEILRLVPMDLREATYALGVPKWKTIMRIVLPTAISGILSGVTISIARVIGETAPILVTAGLATGMNMNVFSGWMTTLPTYIYGQIMRPTFPADPSAGEARAWAAALVLILIVMALNLIARIIARVLAPKASR